jgi:hypothetical protein
MRSGVREIAGLGIRRFASEFDSNLQGTKILNGSNRLRRNAEAGSRMGRKRLF